MYSVTAADLLIKYNPIYIYHQTLYWTNSETSKEILNTIFGDIVDALLSYFGILLYVFSFFKNNRLIRLSISDHERND